MNDFFQKEHGISPLLLIDNEPAILYKKTFTFVKGKMVGALDGAHPVNGEEDA